MAQSRFVFAALFIVLSINLSGCSQSGSPSDEPSDQGVPGDSDSNGDGSQSAGSSVAAVLDDMATAPAVTREHLLDFQAAVAAEFDKTEDIGEAYEAITAAINSEFSGPDGPANFERVDKALAALTLAEEAGDASGEKRRSALKDEDSDADTTVIYVNGIWNTEADYEANKGALQKLINQHRDELPGITVRGAYNRSGLDQCAAIIRGNENSLEKVILVPPALALCWLIGGAEDIGVAIFANIFSAQQTRDVENLRRIIEEELNANRRVIVVSHSDGNSVTRDAVAQIDSGRRSSIGVVMVGSSLGASEMPVTSPDHVRWIGLKHDLVATWGLLRSTASCSSSIVEAEALEQEFESQLAEGRPAEELADTARQFEAAVVQAAVDCPVNLLTNTTGRNGHGFVDSYLTGSESRPRLVYDVQELKCLIPLPGGGLGRFCPCEDEVPHFGQFEWHGESDQIADIIGELAIVDGVVQGLPRTFTNEHECAGGREVLTDSLVVRELVPSNCNGAIGVSISRARTIDSCNYPKEHFRYLRLMYFTLMPWDELYVEASANFGLDSCGASVSLSLPGVHARWVSDCDSYLVGDNCISGSRTFARRLTYSELSAIEQVVINDDGSIGVLVSIALLTGFWSDCSTVSDVTWMVRKE